MFASKPFVAFTIIVSLFLSVLIWQSFTVSALEAGEESPNQISYEAGQIKNRVVFNEFNAWLEKHENNGFSGLNTAEMKTGEELALKRKERLKHLIEQDPRAALESAI